MISVKPLDSPCDRCSKKANTLVLRTQMRFFYPLITLNFLCEKHRLEFEDKSRG
jgi:hypothetical protein